MTKKAKKTFINNEVIMPIMASLSMLEKASLAMRRLAVEFPDESNANKHAGVLSTVIDALRDMRAKITEEECL